MQASLTKTDRAFLALLIASRTASPSLMQGLWSSRWSLIQWAFVFAVLAWLAHQVAGAIGAVAIASTALGALAVQVAHMRRSISRWKLSNDIIDWQKVDALISGAQE